MTHNAILHIATLQEVGSLGDQLPTQLLSEMTCKVKYSTEKIDTRTTVPKSVISQSHS